jgi:phage terminase small subunit
MSAHLPYLPPKRRRFADEYLTDYNATQAAIRSGFSERSAKSQGHRLLTNDDVKAYIFAVQAGRAKQLGFSADRVTRELLFIAFADVSELFEVGEDGRTRFRSPEEWPAELHQAVQGIKIKRVVEGKGADARTFEILDVKLASKIAALTQLAKMLGLIE